MNLITRFYGPNAKGSKLSVKDMDDNLYYLQSFGVDTVNYNNNILTFTNPTGGTYSVNINSFSGLTINGSLSATTFYGDGSNLTGITDTFVTSVTLNSTTIEVDRNEGLSTLSVDLLPVLSGKTDLSLFNTYTGNTETILDTKVENGLSVGGGNEIFSGKSETTLIFNTISGGSNTTITKVGNIQRIDVSVPVDTNTFVSGGTYNDLTDIISLTRNDGVSIEITGVTDTFTTGGTYISSATTINFSNTNGGGFSVTGITTGSGGSVTNQFIKESLAYPYSNPATIGTLSRTFNAGWAYTVPFVLKGDVNINAVTVSITSTSVGQAYFGVYEWDGNTGDVYTKIFQETTAFDTNVSGIQTVTLGTPYTLEKGKLLVCCLISNSNYSARSIRIGSFGSGILGWNSTFTDYNNYLNSFSASLSGSDMPTSITFSRSRDNNQGIIPFVTHLKNT